MPESCARIRCGTKHPDIEALMRDNRPVRRPARQRMPYHVSLVSAGTISSAHLKPPMRLRFPTVSLLLLAFLFPRWVQAQAPGLLWSTNLGATLFAVDAQTNAYANSGGTVFTINSAGVPISTNII